MSLLIIQFDDEKCLKEGCEPGEIGATVLADKDSIMKDAVLLQKKRGGGWLMMPVDNDSLQYIVSFVGGLAMRQDMSYKRKKAQILSQLADKVNIAFYNHLVE